MTLRDAVIQERLRKLREIVRNLEELRSVPREVFVADHRQYWVAERGLQLAAEIVLDVGSHILVASRNVSARDYEDVIRLLGEQAVVTQGLCARLRGLGGFRNVLVHAYLEVDHVRVHDYVMKRLPDFLDFANEIERFLAKQ